MIFASLLFVFLFFTANILSQILIPSAKWKNIFMLGFSLFFYAWTGLRCLLIMLVMVFVCKIGAVAIEKSVAEGKSKKFPLTLTIAACLSILGFFKYSGFFISTAADLTGANLSIPEIILPIGISFYTFQLISYVVDVYRGEVAAQKSYWKLLLYACLFHQCIAGPIVRYKDIQSDLEKRNMTLEGAGKGITRFSIGLAKKAILANGCGMITDHFFAVSAENLTGESVCGILLGCLSFGLQTYLDFSAYSDMAIGMGQMCGLHYKENFNYPLISKSMVEFWRRWHISLSSFFRDYLYFPLGGSRCSSLLQLRNLFIVWFLMGLWHGASWNYVMFGLYFGILLMIGKFIVRDNLDWMPSPFLWAATFAMFLFAQIIFKFTDLEMLEIAAKGLFGLNNNSVMDTDFILTLKNNIYFLILCFLVSTPIANYPRVLLEKLSHKNILAFVIYGMIEIILPPILLIFSANALAGNSYNPFIYFQF